MKTAIKSFFAVVCILATAVCLAQPPKRNTAPQRFKPPKLTCRLGNNMDSAIVTVDEAIQLAKLPLKITDNKNNSYTISSYQCMYTRKAVTEDEGTGKVTPTKSMVADLFKVTPLPDLWKNIISQQIQPGEELYFFDIIVKDAKGRLMFAPNLKIKVK